MVTYSIGEKCVTEFLGMTMAIYFGEAIIANEVLARTKGHDMGWMWVALGFGMAFGLPISMFNFISAKLNPAMLLARATYDLGVNWKTAIALAGCECLGGFVGACLVWLHFLPHFKTVPEPPPRTARDELLRPRDYLGQSALNVAGYNTEQHKIREGMPEGSGPSQVATRVWKDFKYYLQNDYLKPAEIVGLGSEELTDAEGKIRRRSVQVADLHRRLEAERFEFLPTVAEPGEPADEDKEMVERLMAEQERAGVLHEAALIADQNAKLSIFATRPAIYSPIHNFIAEFFATTFLIGVALFIDEIGEMVQQSAKGLWGTLNGLYIGFFIFAWILGFGGPTGVAANIARDTFPRLAHFLLPIPNKGPSEWYYAWIPFFASLCGGLAGGGIFKLFNKLNHSLVPVCGTAPHEVDCGSFIYVGL